MLEQFEAWGVKFNPSPLADIVLAYEDSNYVIAHTAELKTRVGDILNK